MLTDLLAGAKTIRIYLVTGYSVLFCGYLLAGETARDPERWPGTWQRLGELFVSMGSAGRGVFVTLVAAMIGSVVSTLFLEKWLYAMTERSVRWEPFIEEALLEVREYEHYNSALPEKPDPFRAPRLRVPSPHWAAYMYQEVERRQRKRDEIEFRTAIGLAAALPALVLVYQGGPLWALALTPALVVAFERAVLVNRQGRFVIDSRIRVGEEELQRAESSRTQAHEEVRKLETTAPSSLPRKPEDPKMLTDARARRDKADQVVSEIHARLTVLRMARRRARASLAFDRDLGLSSSIRNALAEADRRRL